MKQIQLTLEQAKTLYKKKDSLLKEILLNSFSEQELKGKREWKDLDVKGVRIDEHGHLFSVGCESSYSGGRTNWPTRKMAEASLAMSQLAWWMRQPEYNGEDQDKLCDWEYSSEVKYCLHYDNGHIVRDTWCSHQHFLAFKTKEIRDRFYEDRKELIEQAKPLL